jgi:hypothetical protein
MNKSEVVITMKCTKNGKLLENVCFDKHRKAKAIKLFNRRCIDDGHIKATEIFEDLKKHDPKFTARLLLSQFGKRD